MCSPGIYAKPVASRPVWAVEAFLPGELGEGERPTRRQRLPQTRDTLKVQTRTRRSVTAMQCKQGGQKLLTIYEDGVGLGPAEESDGGGRWAKRVAERGRGRSRG